MSFCKFGSELIDNKGTLVDNFFLKECLPYANDKCVKVYLYGLYKCQNDEERNTIKDFAQELNMTEEDIVEAFWFWDQEGIVKVIEQNPIEVIYLPARNRKYKVNKYKENKYEELVLGIQSYFEGERTVLPTEYNAYIDVIEQYKMQDMAMLRIIKYCIETKGKDITYPYIVQVAKNWAHTGILNLEAVESKIIDIELTSGKLADVLHTLGIKREATLDERQDYIKWTQIYGFLYETIMYIAKNQKKKGGMAKLDAKIAFYYSNKLMSEKEIAEFEQNKEILSQTALEVVKALGLYYETLDNIVETYIIPWQAKGFDKDVLKVVANFCFKSSIRTLDGMDKIVNKFFKLGIVTVEAINEYISDIASVDNVISEIFEKIGLLRRINNQDREFYKIWTENWGFNNEVLMYATQFVKGKNNALNYYNKILSNYKDKGAKTLEEIKNIVFESGTTEKQKPELLKIRSYSDEQLVAMFNNLDEVEI